MTDIPLTNDGGSHAVACTSCAWTLPPAATATPVLPTPRRLRLRRRGDARHRPPHRRHRARVRVVLTTRWPLEQSSTLIGPRSSSRRHA